MNIPTELKENEYLLKVREKDSFGFMTKFNKDGSIPLAFKDWKSRRYGGEDIPIQIHTEEFKKGWKFISYRIGQSQSWATVEHPDGFKLEIYLKNLMEIVEFSTIVKGEIIGKFKWKNKELISEISKVGRERTEKIERFKTNVLIQNMTDEILKTENQELLEMWQKLQEVKSLL